MYSSIVDDADTVLDIEERRHKEETPWTLPVWPEFKTSAQSPFSAARNPRPLS